MNRPIHFEILADNPQKISEFYRYSLGWECNSWTGGEQTYWLVTTGPETEHGINGGIMHRHFDQSVINTVEVKSLEDTLDKIVHAGGKTLRGPSEIPGVGMHAYCAEPEGNIFGVLEPPEK